MAFLKKLLIGAVIARLVRGTGRFGGSYGGGSRGGLVA